MLKQHLMVVFIIGLTAGIANTYNDRVEPVVKLDTDPGVNVEDIKFQDDLLWLAKKPGISFEGEDLVLRVHHPINEYAVKEDAQIAVASILFSIGIGAALLSFSSTKESDRDTLKLMMGIFGVMGVIKAYSSYMEANQNANTPVICLINPQGIVISHKVITWQEIAGCSLKIRKIGHDDSTLTESLTVFGKSGAILWQITSKHMPIALDDLKNIIEKYRKLRKRNSEPVEWFSRAGIPRSASAATSPAKSSGDEHRGKLPASSSSDSDSGVVESKRAENLQELQED